MDDVKHFNFSIGGLSSFKFDNYLKSLERMVKMQIIQLFRYINDLANEQTHQELIKNKSALSIKARDKYFCFKNRDLEIKVSLIWISMHLS